MVVLGLTYEHMGHLFQHFHGDCNAVYSFESAAITAKAITEEMLKRFYVKGAATPTYDDDPELVHEETQKLCVETFDLKQANSIRCGL